MRTGQKREYGGSVWRATSPSQRAKRFNSQRYRMRRNRGESKPVDWCVSTVEAQPPPRTIPSNGHRQSQSGSCHRTARNHNIILRHRLLPQNRWVILLLEKKLSRRNSAWMIKAHALTYSITCSSSFVPKIFFFVDTEADEFLPCRQRFFRHRPWFFCPNRPGLK